MDQPVILIDRLKQHSESPSRRGPIFPAPPNPFLLICSINPSSRLATFELMRTQYFKAPKAFSCHSMRTPHILCCLKNKCSEGGLDGFTEKPTYKHCRNLTRLLTFVDPVFAQNHLMPFQSRTPRQPLQHCSRAGLASIERQGRTSPRPKKRCSAGVLFFE